MTKEEAIKEFVGYQTYDIQPSVEATKMAIETLKQEPKTGHWKYVTDKTGHWVWECDKCGWQQRFNTKFCPDCGAKMIESQESEVEKNEDNK